VTPEGIGMTRFRFTDDRVMLCLAGLAYRGFNDAAAGRFHTDAVRRAVAAGLQTLAPVAGDWELVWGPAVYRAPGSLLDDEMMYVVRRVEGPPRYAVVVRGTNPVSAFDWVFGDLWTGRKIRWRYADGAAHVSLSTALGLAVLQSLRSDGPRRDGALWTLVDARLANASALAETLAGHVLRLAERVTGPLRAVLAESLRTLAAERTAHVTPDAAAHVAALAALWKSRARALVLGLVDRVGELVGDRVDLALLALLEDEARLRAKLGVGADVLTFLGAAVEDAGGPVDVVVTGHSKGGALASTLALCLAETQGETVAPAERWDPEGRATVHCWSYAGPTAGDEGFAARSNALIGPRCHRIVNALDVVPHAWALADLEKIPTLYAAPVARVPALADLVTIVGELTRKLGYTHVGNHVTRLEGTVEATHPLFFHQVVHQHMQAYLDLLDLTPAGVDTATLFDPLAALPR
jgi:hypothetical protein